MYIVYTTLFICELNLCKLQSHKVRRRKQETNNYSQPGWTVRRTDTFTFKSFSREINSLDGSGSDWAREGWGGEGVASGSIIPYSSTHIPLQIFSLYSNLFSVFLLCSPSITIKAIFLRLSHIFLTSSVITISADRAIIVEHPI